MTRLNLTTDAAEHPRMFASAFNSGDPDIVYEESGLLIAEPGVVTTGISRRAANARLAALGVPIDVRPRHVYVTGDLALLIVDWSIVGTARHGERVDVQGTATDVARRGADGYWRYAIDNPFGVA